MENEFYIHLYLPHVRTFGTPEAAHLNFPERGTEEWLQHVSGFRPMEGFSGGSKGEEACEEHLKESVPGMTFFGGMIETGEYRAVGIADDDTSPFPPEGPFEADEEALAFIRSWAEEISADDFQNVIEIDTFEAAGEKREAALAFYRDSIRFEVTSQSGAARSFSLASVLS